MNKYDIAILTDYGDFDLHGIEARSHVEAKDIALELCRLALKEAEIVTFELEDGK